jgi:hypothetical protein
MRNRHSPNNQICGAALYAQGLQRCNVSVCVCDGGGGVVASSGERLLLLLLLLVVVVVMVCNVRTVGGCCCCCCCCCRCCCFHRSRDWDNPYAIKVTTTRQAVCPHLHPTLTCHCLLLLLLPLLIPQEQGLGQPLCDQGHHNTAGSLPTQATPPSTPHSSRGQALGHTRAHTAGSCDGWRQRQPAAGGWRQQ